MKNLFKISAVLIILAAITSFSILGDDENGNEQPGRFWGSQSDCGEVYHVTPTQCAQTCTTKYYVLWMVASESVEIKYVDCN